jgi:hypothetical protein
MAKPGPRPLDFTGQRYGRLVAVSCLGTVDGYRSWSCRCDCGTQEVIVRQESLRGGRKRSCGCLHRRQRMRQSGLDRRREAQRLRCEGLTMRQIGKRMGITHQRVSAMQKKRNGTG